MSCPQQAIPQGSQQHSLSTVTTIPQASQVYFDPFFDFGLAFALAFFAFFFISILLCFT
jgi:hypothetical protein